MIYSAESNPYCVRFDDGFCRSNDRRCEHHIDQITFPDLRSVVLPSGLSDRITWPKRMEPKQ